MAEEPYKPKPQAWILMGRGIFYLRRWHTAECAVEGQRPENKEANHFGWLWQAQLLLPFPFFISEARFYQRAPAFAFSSLATPLLG